jgi:hypothetical protein
MAGTGRKARAKYGDAGKRTQGRAARSIDNLAEYEDFRESILPAIRGDIRDGLTAAQIQEKYNLDVVARQISIALSENDSARALKAIQDLRNRVEGTPVQRVEQKHKLENMDEDQLDALILSKAEAVAKDDKTKH